MIDPNNAIEIRDISKSFKVNILDSSKQSGKYSRRRYITKRNEVFKNFSLNVKKGEILGIIGRNGCGKSTLLSLAAKILEPDSGTVNVSGNVVSILQLSMGFHNDLSGRENVYIKSEMYGMSKSQVNDVIDDIIDYSGVGSYIDNPLRTYSSGMISRLAFAIMVHAKVNIMIADEALSTGDAGFSAKANKTFKQFLKDGKTVLFVSHNLSSIEQMCSRVIWLDSGKIVMDGSPRWVITQYTNAIYNSLDILMESAEYGDIDAQYKLSIHYRDESNDDLYLHWLKRASDNGHSQAQCDYADILYNSGDEENQIIAMSLYQSAAMGGCIEARFKLSATYTNNPFRNDLNELKHVFKELSDLGNPADLKRYGNLMLSIAWSDKDRKDAFDIFLRLAQSGDPDAMLKIANMFLKGNGTKKSNADYLKWTTASAHAGNQKAMQNLADIYFEGKIVQRDEKKAIQYYDHLARQGVSSAQYKLHVMYRDGIGVDADQNLSNYWLSVYSKSILAPFQIQVAHAIDASQLNMGQSSEYYLIKASESFNQDAMSELAEKYLNGGDGDKVSAGIQLLEQLGSVSGKPMLKLADYLFDHITTECDMRRCVSLYRQLSYLGFSSVYCHLYALYIRGAPDIGDDEAIFYSKMIRQKLDNNTKRLMKKLGILDYFTAIDG